ncbi:uncharacterized protein LOC110853220 [Folsomia candida]|uniref:uncharacterized protein LOC110853220 n=1 Tax=Folsomia candida TaxID=158441 RepID=UPI00160532C0|nr:uncharacterized protein LOC110853220 [Folsomia candida]
MKTISFLIIWIALSWIEITSTQDCPPLPKRPDNIVVTCVYPASTTPAKCTGNFASGTVVKYDCAKFFTSAGGDARRREISCINGKWRRLGAFTEFNCNYGCGQPTVESIRQPLIVFGKTAERNRWPWHAAIFRLQEGTENDFIYICGGTLISSPFLGRPSSIITGAHCLTDKDGNLLPNKQFKVVLGAKSSILEKNEKDFHSMVFTVKNISLAPEFDIATHESDLALMHLSEQVELSDYILPVCFPYANSKEFQDIIQLILSTGNTGEVVGFGINEFGKVSESLKYAELPILSPRQCYDALDTIPTFNQFCSGFIESNNGEKNARVCRGDSGGGYIMRNIYAPIKRYYILGVVSFGRLNPNGAPCQSVAVFTRVHKFLDFVARTIEMFELSLSEESEVEVGDDVRDFVSMSVSQKFVTSTIPTTTRTSPTTTTTKKPTTTTTIKKPTTTTTTQKSTTTMTTQKPTTTTTTQKSTTTTTTKKPTTTTITAPKSTTATFFTITTTQVPSTKKPRVTYQETATSSIPAIQTTIKPNTGASFGCPPLKPVAGTVITCHSYRSSRFGTGKPVDCLNPNALVPHKTFAILKCKRLYKLGEGVLRNSAEIFCQSNSKWSELSPSNFHCVVDCGTEAGHMQDLINGKHSCPAAAGLFYENPVGSRNYKLFCHATMIGNSARALVTAAHCATRSWMKEEILTSDKSVVAVVGKFHRIFELNDFRKVQLRHVVDFDVHPSYRNTTTSTGDIALLWLDKEVQITEHTRPMCLPKANEKAGEYGSLIWGSPLTGGRKSSIPKIGSASLSIGVKVCKPEQPIHRRWFSMVQRNRPYCDVEKPGLSTCDIGGGGCVITRSGDLGRWVIEGVVSPAAVGSQGEDCHSGRTSVFIRFSYFRNWIDSMLRVKDVDSHHISNLVSDV